MLTLPLMQNAAELSVTPSEVLAGGMIKGGMMAAHLAWATEGRRPDDVGRFWNALPTPVADSLQGTVLAIKWYPFAHLVAVDRAIVDVYGRGSVAVLREVGANSAAVNLTGIYKIYRRDSIHEFLETNARLHRQFQDFGEASYLKTSPSSGMMVVSGYPSYSPLFCESAIGFYRHAVEIHEGRNVEVNETSCQCLLDAQCTFEIQWR